MLRSWENPNQIRGLASHRAHTHLPKLEAGGCGCQEAHPGAWRRPWGVSPHQAPGEGWGPFSGRWKLWQLSYFFLQHEAAGSLHSCVP